MPKVRDSHASMEIHVFGSFGPPVRHLIRAFADARNPAMAWKAERLRRLCACYAYDDWAVGIQGAQLPSECQFSFRPKKNVISIFSGERRWENEAKDADLAFGLRHVLDQDGRSVCKWSIDGVSWLKGIFTLPPFSCTSELTSNSNLSLTISVPKPFHGNRTSNANVHVSTITIDPSATW
jgi:hypothetical protein